jgi:RimJ/RimL family protein N-acetyltransferase
MRRFTPAPWIERHDQLREDRAAFPFAIVDRFSGRLLGCIGIQHPGDPPQVGVVGYWVAAWARNNGVATRALELVTAWAFRELSLESLYLFTLIGNIASERVADKGGYRVIEELTDYRHPRDPAQSFHAKRWVRVAKA